MPDSFVDYYFTPYGEDTYCFVHSSGNPKKFIFSTRFAPYDFHSGTLKFIHHCENRLLIVNENGTKTILPYRNIPLTQIVGTAIRQPYLIPKKLVQDC